MLPVIDLNQFNAAILGMEEPDEDNRYDDDIPFTEIKLPIKKDNEEWDDEE